MVILQLNSWKSSRKFPGSWSILGPTSWMKDQLWSIELVTSLISFFFTITGLGGNMKGLKSVSNWNDYRKTGKLIEKAFSSSPNVFFTLSGLGENMKGLKSVSNWKDYWKTAKLITKAFCSSPNWDSLVHWLNERSIMIYWSRPQYCCCSSWCRLSLGEDLREQWSALN